MNHALLPGPGDLLPIYAGHPHDPRTTPEAEEVSDVDACQGLLDRMEWQIEIARTSLFRRDVEKYNAAIAKVGELARLVNE